MDDAVESLNPIAQLGGFWSRRSLIWQMTKREVVGRYRGSVLGLVWSFVNPLLLLGIYTFVFGIVFKARFAQEHSDKVQFAIVLFAGLIVYNLFAETINRAPTLILGNVNFVKKVVFPLQVLPVVAMGSALFHSLASFIVLFLFLLVTGGALPYTAFLLPVVVLPLVVFTLGAAWFLAALGVYIRDISHTIGLLMTALLFLSPVFYPVSALPAAIRPYIFLNPLTLIIEETRNVLIWGKGPGWPLLALYTAISLAVAIGGLMWFQKARRGFADVL